MVPRSAASSRQHCKEKQMKSPQSKILTAIAAGLTLATIASAPTFAQMKEEKPVSVGGAPMYASKNIVQNAVNSKDHTTLVTAVKAAGLVDTLSGAGPFTVFAPTNEAFAKLPKGTVDNLLKPENKEMLTKVLTYHVVAGRMTAKDLMEAAKKAGGKAMIKTVEGADLTVEAKGNDLMIIDAKGDVAKVTIDNVFQSNGVIQVVDTVLLPG
jgi:uncharacterized surface protein with fasciclin (FAS1) repeats